MSKIEREHTCENCYYEEVDGYAYPCNRCSHNKPTDDMWRQRSKSMSKTELGMLKVGDILYLNGQCYRAGHSDGRGYAYCTNVNTGKVKRIHLTTVVEEQGHV